MFFDIYEDLCRSKGKKPSAVAAELGINKSNVSNWKNNGYTPRGESLQRIAEYFGVSSDYLLGNEKKPTVSDGLSEAQRTLIQFAESLTEEQATQALRVLKAVLGDDQ